MNRYRLLLVLLSIPVVIHAAWLALRNKDFKYFSQRLGLMFTPLKNKRVVSIWIHAASVGEVNAAVPLIHKLAQNNSVILTTNTPSSAVHANNILSTEVTHFYCPVDWQWAIRKFILQLRPQCLFIIETELWPNLFSVCHAMNLPITIVNGRLSKRTLHTSPWIKKRYQASLQTTKAILTRSAEDTQRFIKLGAPASIVKTIGNIKFYQLDSQKDIATFKTVKPYVLAASTRDDEEILIVDAWQEAINKIEASSHLLIIVPRHPRRLNTIIKQLEKFNLNIAIRSRNETIAENTDLYIADTFGELVTFIKGAEFVIMGGSFVNKGGQNILEVAHAQKTVVFGPYMTNFQDEALLFVNNKAGIQLENAKALPETIYSLLTQPAMLEELQHNAVQLMLQQQTVLDKYLSELQKIYPELKIK